MNFEQELWRRIRFPAPDHFQRELIDLYLDASALYGKPLVAAYLAPIIKHITEFYAVEFPAEYDERNRAKLADPSKTYKLILSLFTNSLIQFTRVYPYKDVSADTLFVLTKPTATPEAICDPLFAEALYALQAPFIAAQPALSQHGFRWENWAPSGYNPFSKLKPVESFDPTKAERYAYRQQLEFWKEEKRQYEELHAKAHKLIDPISKAVAHSPYYAFARTLDPGPYSEHFEIREDRWFEGCWIVAASGAGKTNLLRHLILHRLEQDATVMIIDSKGDLDLFSSFNRLAAIKDRLVVLENSHQHPLAINPFDTPHPVEFLDYLFTIFNSGLTAQQSLPFSAVFRLLNHLPNPTLLKFSEIMVDGVERYKEYITQLGERDRRFFEKEFNGPRWRERRQDVEARLKLLLDRNELVGAMLSSPTTRVKMDELLESGKVICIDNSINKLGTSGAEFMGRLYVALIWYAGLARRGSKPVYVFLDEAHHFIKDDPHIGDMITSLRSKRIGLAFAHQFVGQIESTKARGGLNTCALKFFNTTGEPGVSVVSFFPGADQIVYDNLGQGDFATFVKFKPGGNFNVLHIPPYDVIEARDTYAGNPLVNTFLDKQRYPIIEGYEYRALMITMHERYSTKPFHDRPSDTIFEENHINPNLADRGGIYKTKLRLDVHGREWRWAEIAIPANMKEGYKVKFPAYGVFRRDGTRGDLIHILYRRKSDGPQTTPAELGRKTSRGKRHQSPPPRQDPIEDW